MRVVAVVLLVLLLTAFYGPVLAEEPVLADDPAPDLDALILAGLENRTVTDEIERVLQDEDTLQALESACCLVEEQMAGVSHSTYERIKQTYATDERVTNLLESHVKRDSKVDLTFTGMPQASEGWLVRLIVVIVVIVIITVVMVVAHYAAPALAPVGEAAVEAAVEVPAVEVDAAAYAAAYANARDAIGAGERVVRTAESMLNLGKTLADASHTPKADSIIEFIPWSDGGFLYE